MTLLELWGAIQAYGSGFLLFLYIIGIYMEWHVTGKQHKKLEIRADRFEAMAWDNLDLAKRLLSAIEKAQTERERAGP